MSGLFCPICGCRDYNNRCARCERTTAFMNGAAVWEIDLAANNDACTVSLLESSTKPIYITIVASSPQPHGIT